MQQALAAVRHSHSLSLTTSLPLSLSLSRLLLSCFLFSCFLTWYQSIDPSLFLPFFSQSLLHIEDCCCFVIKRGADYCNRPPAADVSPPDADVSPSSGCWVPGCCGFVFSPLFCCVVEGLMPFNGHNPSFINLPWLQDHYVLYFLPLRCCWGSLWLLFVYWKVDLESVEGSIWVVSVSRCCKSVCVQFWKWTVFCPADLAGEQCPVQQFYGLFIALLLNYDV